jgi:hypothetical protein
MEASWDTESGAGWSEAGHPIAHLAANARARSVRDAVLLRELARSRRGRRSYPETGKQRYEVTHCRGRSLCGASTRAVLGFAPALGSINRD